MARGNILGIDLNDNYCQISYYDINKDEPETLEVSRDNFEIPMVLGYLKDHWIYGKEAKRIENFFPEHTVNSLYSKAVKREKLRIGEQERDSVWLLAKYISMCLEQFADIEMITFSVPECSVDISNMLKGIGQRIGVAKECIQVQDYKESFCNYMFYQPKELWKFETALFYCDDKEISAYMLRSLDIESEKYDEKFVTVEKVADAQIEELSAIYPVINAEKAKDADFQFKSLIENVFEQKVISSVYLTGDGFEQNWYPESLRVLCNGRRAFFGNNLYSKGACYHSLRSYTDMPKGPVYLDSSKMIRRICLKLVNHGKEEMYPVVCWGKHWYEADTQLELIVSDLSEVEIFIDSLGSEETKKEIISLNGIPERNDYSMRLLFELMFMNESSCKIKLKDIGFGDFFPASEFCVEKILDLGGIDGQFNTLSR